MSIEVGDIAKATHVGGDSYIGTVTDSDDSTVYLGFLGGDVELYTGDDWSFELIVKGPKAVVGDTIRNGLPIGTLIETKDTSCAGNWFHSARGWVNPTGELFLRSVDGDIEFLLNAGKWKIAYLPSEN